MFADRLLAAIEKKGSPICVGLDPIFENLPDEGFRFHAAPVKVKAFGTFPVRAYAVLDR